LGEGSSSDNDDDITLNSSHQQSALKHAPQRSRTQSFKSVRKPRKNENDQQRKSPSQRSYHGRGHKKKQTCL
jgi:hypothetical protein